MKAHRHCPKCGYDLDHCSCSYPETDRNVGDYERERS